MLRFSVLFLLLACAACDNALAKNNPCGGIYPADGVAAVRGATLQGDVAATGADGKVVTSAYATSSNETSFDDTAPCMTFVNGVLPSDGSGSAGVAVNCHGIIVTFTVPDMRESALASELSVPATIAISDGQDFEGTPCGSATAKLVIDRAAGGIASSSPYVTADFVRGGMLTLDAPENGDASCPARVVVTSRVDLAAADLGQAMATGEDHCPELPYK